MRGLEEAAYLHLMAVTGMDQAQAYLHVQGAYALWEARSERTWELDLSMLTDVGVTVRRPPQAGERPAAAQEAFAATGDGIRQRAQDRARAEGIRSRAAAHAVTAVSPATSPAPVVVSDPLASAVQGAGHGLPALPKTWLARLVARLRGK